MSTTLDDIIGKMKELTKTIDLEFKTKQKIRQSPAYLLLNEEQEKLEDRIRILNKSIGEIIQRKTDKEDMVNDSNKDLSELKRLAIAIMSETGMEGYSASGVILKSKWSMKQSVDAKRVLEALEGDIDLFLDLASISQKDIKEYAKEQDSKIMKKALYDCIQVDSREIADIEIEITESVLPALASSKYDI